MRVEIDIDYAKLKRAIIRSPQTVADETQKFFMRASAEYKRSILSSPWRMGMSGGGVPVGKGYAGAGNLKNSHLYKIEPFKLHIKVDEKKADYAKYVHGIEGYPRTRTYQLRPWLKYAYDTQQTKIDQHQKTLLDQVTKALGE